MTGSLLDFFLTKVDALISYMYLDLCVSLATVSLSLPCKLSFRYFSGLTQIFVETLQLVQLSRYFNLHDGR